MSKNQAMEKIGEALKGPGLHLGDVVWLSLGSVSITRDELRNRLVTQGLPESLAPDDPSAQAAFGAAVTHYREGNRNMFLRRVERGRRGGDVVIVHQVGADKADFKNCGRMGVKDDGTLFLDRSVDWVEDASGVVSAVQANFEHHKSYVSTPELSSMVVNTLLNWCGGIRLRDRGNIYWCHEAGKSEVRSLASVIEGIGGSYMSVLPVHDTQVYVCPTHGGEMSPTPGACGVCGRKLHATKEARHAVSRAATESFEAELASIFKELDDFRANSPRESTLERRLDEFEDLRNRVDLYADILDKQKDRLSRRLDEATEQVKQMIATV